MGILGKGLAVEIRLQRSVGNSMCYGLKVRYLYDASLCLEKRWRERGKCERGYGAGLLYIQTSVQSALDVAAICEDGVDGLRVARRSHSSAVVDSNSSIKV